MININCDLVGLWKECELRRKLISDLETNLKELKDEREKLREKKSVRERQLSNAEDRGLTATDTLRGWFGRVVRMEEELKDILGPEEDPTHVSDKCFSGFCADANVVANELLTNSVANILPRVKGLREERLDEADMFTLSAVDDLPVDEIVGMDSKLEEVWGFLGEKGAGIIRIVGMGGVGKTAFLKTLNNRFREEPLGFNLVIWVDSSSSCDVESVQLAIGHKLGLTWPETATQHTRSTNLNVALQKKAFVLFIDDPHKDLTINSIGIPIAKSNKNKVVFSTRDEAVCMGLNGDQYRTIKVDRLESIYAKTLFERTVGQETLNSDPAIPALAHSLAVLCDRLPITLVTVGRAMSRKKTPKEWRNAIEMLAELAHQFEGMDKVYEKFLVSYKGLHETAQCCFLYCSLFPRASSIQLEELINYWIGESFLNRFGELSKNRNDGYSIISTLKSAYLLESGKDVQMHDTVRGSALWIAAGCGKHENKFWVRFEVKLVELPTDSINWEEMERISLVKCHIEKLNKIKCSKILTLILKQSTFGKISRDFFQTLSSLKVLDLSWCNLDTFPSDITTLTELQYLNLSHTNISELPNEFKQLTKLKFLDLSFLRYRLKIPPGVIACLSKVQVLNLYCSGFENQILEGNVLSGSGDGFHKELKHLKYLEDLRITVTGAVAFQSFCKSPKLCCTHSLFITKCRGLTKLQMPIIENMKVFHISNCPNLAKFEINWCQKEEDITVEGHIQRSEIREVGCFGNLHHVEIESCWELKNLSWLKCAPTLKSLRVVNCMLMEEVMSDVGTSAEVGWRQHHLFSNLRSIYLDNLPNLKFICNGTIPFPLLEKITVLFCPKMQKLPLDANNTKNKFKYIRGQKNWWDKLQCEDEAKSKFSAYFVPIE